MMDGIGTKGSFGIGKNNGINERTRVIVGNPSRLVSKYVG
jgi:hypothetical protein